MSKIVEPISPDYAFEDPVYEGTQHRIDTTFAKLEASILEVAELRTGLNALIIRRETQARYELECAKRNYEFVLCQKEKLRRLFLQVPASYRTKTEDIATVSEFNGIQIEATQQNDQTISIDFPSLVDENDDTIPSAKVKIYSEPEVFSPQNPQSDSDSSTDSSLGEGETVVESESEVQVKLARVERVEEVRAKIELWNQRIHQETAPRSSLLPANEISNSHRGPIRTFEQVDLADMVEKARQERRVHEENQKKAALRIRADRKARSYGGEREMQDMGVTKEAKGTRGLRALSLVAGCQQGWYRHRGTFSYSRPNPSLDTNLLDASSNSTSSDHNPFIESPIAMLPSPSNTV